MLKSYIDPTESREAKRKLPKLMVEGLLLGGTGLGVLALIFEIAADKFVALASLKMMCMMSAKNIFLKHR